jgi:two-component system NtrC family sensor kinase
MEVINSSPGDLAPVFDEVLAKAHSLCDVARGSLEIYNGENFRAVATHGLAEDFAEQLRQGYPASMNPATRPLIEGRAFTHIHNTADHEFPFTRNPADATNARTLLCVALRREDKLLGMIAAARDEVRPFTDKQIALLQNFAAQAVIAMENARLITETREALEQQTATAEVLGVINSSPGDLAPVFDAMLEKALRLCDAAFGLLHTYEGDDWHRTVASHGVPAPILELFREPVHLGPETGLGRLVRGERFVHIPDAADDEAYRLGNPLRRALVEVGGTRTYLAVPLCKDDRIIGGFTIYRQEMRPFTDKQIALLQSFAAQAVIAMENARLLDDLRQRTSDLQESLQYQTATSDVLKVISQSTFDLAPVLQTVLDTAMRLCGNTQGQIWRLEDGVYRMAVSYGLEPTYRDIEEKLAIRPGSDTLVGRTAVAGKPIHIVDALADPEYAPKDDARLGNLRSMLGVPLLREGTPIGVICTARRIVEPFTEKQIELVSTFADQAVIAIDNARLLNEIRQRQAELRVTFDNMGDGVAMFDTDLRLAAWNLNFQRILDLPDDLLAARPSYADYIRLLAERGEFGTDDIEAELNTRLEHTDQELRLERTRPDGHVIEVRRNAVPGGGFVLIYSDVTERKRAEAEIREARDAAEAALRELQTAQASLVHAQKMAALGQLTAGIAHEIKNPLNFVNNFAGLSVELLDELKETAAPGIATLDEDTRAEIDDTAKLLTGNLEKIVEHGQRADGIVKSMLEHSRGGSGERRAVNLNALVDEALNLAYHGARAQDQSFNITMDREFDAAVAPIEVVPQDVTRVFLNLFGNGFYAAAKRSLEATDGYRPVLKVMTRDIGNAIEVRIRDNGSGIPPEIRDKLFQPFVTTKPTGEGTGLGLSISYEIVTLQHGGTIEVDSEPGAFTEFTVRLPRRSNGTGAENGA